MKGFGQFLIFVAVSFAVAAVFQTRESDEEMIQRSNDSFRSDMKAAQGLSDLASFLGGSHQNISPRSANERAIYADVSSSESRVSSLKEEREKRMWIFSGISGVSFLAGIICVSTARPKEEDYDDSDFEDLDEESLDQIEKKNFRPPTLAEMAVTVQVFLWMANRQEGPYTLGQIRSMWNVGTLTADTLYWAKDSDEWLPLVLLMEGETIPS